MWKWMRLIVTLLMVACAQSIETVEASLEPIAILFETDFPSVYGEIRVTVDGASEVVTLNPGRALRDCNSPDLWLPPGKLEFAAASRQRFVWNGMRNVGSNKCETIDLDSYSIASGVVAIGADLSITHCGPTDFWVEAEGETEWYAGEIGQLGKPNFEYNEMDEESQKFYMIQDARAKDLVVWGSGAAERASFRFRWKTRPELCPSLEGSGVVSVARGESLFMFLNREDAEGVDDEG